MLIIGHRGAAGEKLENTLPALQAAIDAGADMVEFDVRMTKDHKAILSHDPHLRLADQSIVLIQSYTLKELQKRTAGSDQQIVTLKNAIKLCHDKIFMMIEAKDKGSGVATLELVTQTYKTAFDTTMITSFSARELARVRNFNKKIKLGMLMRLNPLAFLAWERKLHLSAVGLHRLHLNPLSVQAARQLKMFVYVYTVNRKAALSQLESKDVDGVVTDYPSKFASPRR